MNAQMTYIIAARKQSTKRSSLEALGLTGQKEKMTKAGQNKTKK